MLHIYRYIHIVTIGEYITYREDRLFGAAWAARRIWQAAALRGFARRAKIGLDDNG